MAARVVHCWLPAPEPRSSPKHGAKRERVSFVEDGLGTANRARGRVKKVIPRGRRRDSRLRHPAPSRGRLRRRPVARAGCRSAWAATQVPQAPRTAPTLLVTSAARRRAVPAGPVRRADARRPRCRRRHPGPDPRRRRGDRRRDRGRRPAGAGRVWTELDEMVVEVLAWRPAGSTDDRRPVLGGPRRRASGWPARRSTT